MFEVTFLCSWLMVITFESPTETPFQIKPLHKTSFQSIFLFNLNVRKPLNCAPDILTCTILRDSIN